MGLFEQIESEAEIKRREALRGESLRRSRAALWSREIEPRMRDLDTNLQQLVGELSARQPTARLTWTLPGYGEVVAYIDHRYTLRSQPGETAYEISLSCHAEVASNECPLVMAEGVPAVTEVAAALWKQRLFGVLHAQRNGAGEAVSARFQARGRVLLGLQLTAAAADGCARLQTWNIAEFGQRRRDLTVEQLQPSLFDAFARFLDSPTLQAVAPATAACGRRADRVD
jgi:hypothetical protein